MWFFRYRISKCFCILSGVAAAATAVNGDVCSSTERIPQAGQSLLQQDLRPGSSASVIEEGAPPLQAKEGAPPLQTKAAAVAPLAVINRSHHILLDFSSTGQEMFVEAPFVGGDLPQIEEASKVASVEDYSVRHESFGSLGTESGAAGDKSCLVDSLSSQVVTFWAIVIVVALNSGLLLWQSLKASEHRSAIALAITGAIYFGVDNFLIAYSSRYLCDPQQHMPILFLMIGCIALLVHCSLYIFSSSYRQEWLLMWLFSWVEPLFCAGAGIAIGLAQVFANLSFAADQVNAGANQALVCANIIFVSIFFWVSRGESMTLMQGLACAIMMVGVYMMSTMDALTSDTDINAGDHNGFWWIALSTMMYAISIVLLKYAGTCGLSSERARLILVILAIGTTGVCLHISSDRSANVSKVLSQPWRLLWPTANALAGALGMAAVLMAYEVPNGSVGIVTGVIDSNSVVMCTLNFLILAMFPEMEKVVGMGFILAAVLGLAVLEWYAKPEAVQGKESKEDSEDRVIDWDEVSDQASA
mmetsp:Transcript_56346/g.132082  ORF Transcript_56346/g.132082 Transcript_56346/m.132082 type:complete len:530 (+) Transcript_56346:39-1628(+)